MSSISEMPKYDDSISGFVDGATYHNIDTDEYMIYDASNKRWNKITKNEAIESGKFVGSWTSGVRKNK